MARVSPRFRDYFQDELDYLEQRSQEFAQANPDIAADLHLRDLKDPDVAMLLKGFAFLSGRIRQSLDAEFPELLYPLMAQLWPHALRPTPAATVVELRPKPGFKEPQEVPRGKLVHSIEVQRVKARFRTCFAVTVLPVKLSQLRLEFPSQQRALLRLRLEVLPSCVPSEWGGRPLRLFLRGQPRQRLGLYGLLGQGAQERPLRRILLRALGKGSVECGTGELPLGALRQLGFGVDESLLPYGPEEMLDDAAVGEAEPQVPAFPFFRHLHEYLSFPSKYLFFDLDWGGWLKGAPRCEAIEVLFEVDADAAQGLTLEDDAAKNIRLHCTPVINLAHQRVSQVIDHRHAEYLVRADGDPEHHDIFSVLAVHGHLPKTPQPVAYAPFYSFQRRPGQRLYQVRLRERVSNQATDASGRGRNRYRAVDSFLSFVEPEGAPLPGEISVDLLVTNRDLLADRTEAIMAPDSPEIPGSLLVEGLGELSTAAPAPVGRDGLWRFFAHLTLGLDQLRDADALRSLLELYHLPSWDNPRERAAIQPLLQALQRVTVRPDSRVMPLQLPGTAGLPPALVCGTAVSLQMDDSLLGRGGLCLFGDVLRHYLAETATLNSYVRLSIQGTGGDLTWTPRTGTQPLL